MSKTLSPKSNVSMTSPEAITETAQEKIKRRPNANFEDAVSDDDQARHGNV